MKYVFDIDGTLTLPDATKDYPSAKPDMEAIAEVNRLFDEGHSITLFTARGASSGKDWHKLTEQQLKDWGVKYCILIDKGKPSWDIFIDDKAINANEWKKTFKKRRVGFVASTFDLLHAGHCLMLEDAKKQCDFLIAAVQEDPTADRPYKNKPVMSLGERIILVRANKNVDQICVYRNEKELSELLRIIQPDVRIVGDDYVNRTWSITGMEYCKEIYFHKRSDHKWSTSELRKRVIDANKNN